MSKCQGEKVLCNTTFPFNANNSGTHASGNQPPIVNTPTDSNTGGEPKIDQRTFPEHLMDIIEEETRDGYGILEWAAGGESFVIRDKLKLETEVLPRYFHTKCKYMSFFRKLYRWGFRQREKNSPDNNLIFYNKYFKRGDKKQCLQLRSIVKRPSPTVASRAAVKSSSTTANRSCNLTEIPNDLHVVHNGILNNSPQFQNEILTSLQLQGSGAGVMSISSFASRQDGIGNNFGLPSLGNTGNNQMHMSMLSNTHHHQQQQQQHPEVMSSVYNRDSDDNWFPTRAAFATNWFNALENSSLHITRNTDGNTMNNDIGNNFSNDLNSNNKFANFSIMFPTGNRNNQRGMLPMDFLRASISNFSSVRTDQIQTQHDMYNRYCFNSQSSPTQGSYTFGNNSYSGGGNSNNNVGPY